MCGQAIFILKYSFDLFTVSGKVMSLEDLPKVEVKVHKDHAERTTAFRVMTNKTNTRVNDYKRNDCFNLSVRGILHLSVLSDTFQ